MIQKVSRVELLDYENENMKSFIVNRYPKVAKAQEDYLTEYRKKTKSEIKNTKIDQSRARNVVPTTKPFLGNENTNNRTPDEGGAFNEF